MTAPASLTNRYRQSWSASSFSITEVLRWDTAAIRLVDAAAIQLFLRGRGLSESAARATRLPMGHPEAFIEAFANIYRGVAEAIQTKRGGSGVGAAMEFP